VQCCILIQQVEIEGGYPMKSLKKIIDDFLKRLAAQNKEQFGGERLDCCKLDRPKNDGRK